MADRAAHKKTPENEISFKDLILKARDWTWYLLRKWKIIVLAGVIGAGLGLLRSFITPVKYRADLTFVVNEGNNNSLGAYTGIASQFGIDLGSSTSGILEGDNVIQFLQSELVLEKTLLSSVDNKKGTITLADYFLNFSGWRKSWENNPAAQNIRFPAGQDRNSFTLQQDSVLQLICKDVNANMLTVGKPDKKLSFIKVTCTTKDERFSKLFAERLVTAATDFYVDTRTKQAKENVVRLQEQADSVLQLLNKKTYVAAEKQDLNLNPARSVATVNAEMAIRDKSILMTIYGEIAKNLGMAKMALVQQTPVIQLVDVPRLPLEKEKFGKLKGLIIGGILGGFLIVVVLLCRKIYVEVLDDDHILKQA
jgi:hypothetical protein